jgi:hypothetical protein
MEAGVMSHRSIFKPMKDHPELAALLERKTKHVTVKAPPECPNCCDERDCASVDICNAIHDVYASDVVSPIHHPSVEKGRV